MGKARKALVATITRLVKLYQFMVSPWLGARCRYEPSCSDYMLDAVLYYGPVKGIWMGLKRVTRCNPWGGQGYDPLLENTRRPGAEANAVVSSTRGVQH
jgi:putative membrane protein insertion efficiency factor